MNNNLHKKNCRYLEIFLSKWLSLFTIINMTFIGLLVIYSHFCYCDITMHILPFLCILLLVVFFLVHNILFLLLMGDEHDEDVIKPLISRNQTLCSYLTLGLYSTYLLDCYYLAKVYPKGGLAAHVGTNGIHYLLVMTPILNLFIYYIIIYRLKAEGYYIPLKTIVIYYLTGRLTSYLIENTEYHPSQDKL